MQGSSNKKSAPRIRWALVGYDLIIYAAVAFLLLILYNGRNGFSSVGVIEQIYLSAGCIFAARLIGKVYGQVWRYGGIQSYLRLVITDFAAFLVYLILEMSLPVQKITFARMLSIVSVNL